MASRASKIAEVARQIFGTLPNRGVRTGMQFLKKPLTGEYEARYYLDSIEPHARKVCDVWSWGRKELSRGRSVSRGVLDSDPVGWHENYIRNYHSIYFPFFRLFTRTPLWMQGSTTLFITSHLHFGITRATADEAPSFTPEGKRTTQKGFWKTIQINKWHDFIYLPIEAGHVRRRKLSSWCREGCIDHSDWLEKSSGVTLCIM